jgi:uncharacterized protein (DUF1697 family)
MQTYIALLRGINVGGHNKNPMPALKNAFTEINCKNIRTYIQSGNVVFEYSRIGPAIISERIHKKIEETFGCDVPVIIRTPEKLQSIISSNPFLKEKGIASDKRYVLFFSDTPHKNAADAMSNYQFADDRFVIAGNTLYLYCHNGYGRTKLNAAFFESKLKIAVTARNLKTVIELFRISTE